jgi:hypothetical protein
MEHLYQTSQDRKKDMHVPQGPGIDVTSDYLGVLLMHSSVGLLQRSAFRAFVQSTVADKTPRKGRGEADLAQPGQSIQIMIGNQG